MNTTRNNTIKGAWQKLKGTLRERNRKLLRSIEYKRLKRIRKKSVPSYRYCKNCGTELKGMYCHQCGQYALDYEQPFWKYIVQYFENMYSFDGKVWITIWTLLRHPGMLTKEFNAGKVSSYVHPMKLLMSFSTIFFLFTIAYLNQFLDSIYTTKTPDEFPYENFSDGEFPLDSIESNNITLAIVTDSARIVEFPKTYKLLTCSPSTAPDSTYQDTVQVRTSKRILALPFWKLIGDWNETPLVQVDRHSIDNYDKCSKLVLGGLLNFIGSYALIILLIVNPLIAKIIQFSYRKSQIPYMGHLVFALYLATSLEINTAIFITALYIIKEILILLNVHLVASVAILILNIAFPLFILTYTVIASKIIYERGWLESIGKTLWIFFCFFIIMLIVTIGLLTYFNDDILAILNDVQYYWGIHTEGAWYNAFEN